MNKGNDGERDNKGTKIKGRGNNERYTGEVFNLN